MTEALSLKRAMGSLSEREFKAALAQLRNMKPENVDVARKYLVAPGRLQVLIAEETGMSKQLVYRHCKRLYDAHCKLRAPAKTGESDDRPAA
ncbi:TrfB-related DNA-binding protein (plasmid) [Pseudoduganella sp. UC29_106]|uniref:TrfB-related DNA-binding protein n=1 Tax=Pseudoduganella sp. UC29_106 TaxID=3374553 RepID=UPI003756E31B